MKIIKLPLIATAIIALLLLSNTVQSQVGIGTTEPHLSAILDMQSTNKGMLAPRMTSAERIAIVDPANGLLVYDTTENSFYFFKLNAWVKQDASVGTRSNYKLIKSSADLSQELAYGGGSKYLLETNTLYEINGTIVLTKPIDLNNAYILGLDSGEDKLVRTSGSIFEGGKGGSIKNVTLFAKAGQVFDLTGSITENLILRDLIIVNSASVGSISGYNMVFKSVVQYLGNTTGITYANINNLLLSNTGWFGTNLGTYETYTGTFGFIEKQGGFIEANGTAKGIDVSSNPTVNVGVLTGVSFSGTTSADFVQGYGTGSYPGYKFTNTWTVDCPGLKVESDEVAAASVYFDGGYYDVNTSTAFNLIPDNPTNNIKAVNILRTATPNNRSTITYVGKSIKTFQVNAALSIEASVGWLLNGTYEFFIRKNGTTLSETKTRIKLSGSATDFFNLSILGTVELSPNDFIELYGSKVGGSNTTMRVISINLSIK